MSQLLRTKSIDALIASSEEPEHRLRKTLGPWSLTALGIGAVIGSGIFTLTGTAAAGKVEKIGSLLNATILDLLTQGVHAGSVMGRPGAGPAITLSFVLVGFACCFAALCYAELASMIPIAGSAYTYAYAVLGEIFAWIIGWDLILEYAVSNMSVAVGFSAYLQDLGDNLFHFHLPAAIAYPRNPGARRTGRLLQRSGTGDHDASHLGAGPRRARKRGRQYDYGRHQDRGHPDLLLWGRRLSEQRQLASVRAAWFLRRPHGRLHRLLYLHRFRLGLDRGGGVRPSAARPPLRHHRHADRLHGFVRVGIVVLTGIMPYYQTLGTDSPVADALKALGYNRLRLIVTAGALMGMISSLLVYQYGQARIWFAMSRDRLLPGAVLGGA